VAHAGEPDLAALQSDAIIDFKVAGLHPHLDSKAGEREDASSANWGFAEC